MVENPRAREVNQREQRPRSEISERQREDIRARFEADTGNDIEARAAGLKADAVVERMSKDGALEKWRVLEVRGDIVTLGRGARQEVLSRNEVALEARAAEYGPSLAKYWESVMVTTETISDARKQAKAKALLEKSKMDIMRMAALTVANDNPADLESALHHAMMNVIEDHADDRADAKLGRAIDANDGLLNLRFGPNPHSLDEVQEITTRIGVDMKGSMSSLEADKAAQVEKTLPLAMAKAAEAAIDVPQQALAPARGELATYAALETMLELDSKQLNIADINTHLARLDELRGEIERSKNSLTRLFAIIDLQSHKQALLSQRATMTTENFGAVQQMLQELRAQKPADRKRGRPVDVGALMIKLQVANIALRSLKIGTPKWSIKTQENWALEKRILEATGRTEELRPENFSQVYAYYKEAIQAGTMSKEDALAALEDLGRDSNILTGKDVEGMRLLFDELISDPVGTSIDDDLEVVDEQLEKALPTPVEVEYDESNDEVGSSLDDDIAVIDTTKFPNEPAVVARKYDKDEAPTKPPTPLRERNTVRMLRPDLAPVSLRREFTEDDWMQEGDNGDFDTAYAPAAETMEKIVNHDTLYGKVNVEAPKTDNDPFRRIAAAFGGVKEFRRLNKELEARTGRSLDLTKLSEKKKMSRSEEQRYIAAFSKAVGIPVENKERPPTPLEQVAEAFGGEENFETIYQELEDADLAPYDLKKLRAATKFKNGQAKEVIAKINAAVKTLEKKSGRDSLIRPPTPLEQIAEEFGGIDIFKKNLEDLAARGKSPYTLEDLKNIPEPTFFQRLFPWRNPTEVAIREIREAMKPKKKRGGLQS